MQGNPKSASPFFVNLTKGPERWFSKGVLLPPQRAGGTVCRQFWLSYLVGVGVTTGIWWMKVRDAAKKPYNAQNSPP